MEITPDMLIDCETMSARVLPSYCGTHPNCEKCKKRPKKKKILDKTKWTQKPIHTLSGKKKERSSNDLTVYEPLNKI